MRAVTPEDFLKLRRYLDTVGTRLEELRNEKTTRAPSEPSERSLFYLCYV